VTLHAIECAPREPGHELVRRWRLGPLGRWQQHDRHGTSHILTSGRAGRAYWEVRQHGPRNTLWTWCVGGHVLESICFIFDEVTR
jgi:hypothetical protein